MLLSWENPSSTSTASACTWGKFPHCGKHPVLSEKGRPTEPKDYRPVALTSHVMKVLDRLILHQISPQHAQDPLQFAYREKIGVEDAVLYLQYQALSYLDKGRCAVRILFFNFSSTFNTIQPALLQEKLSNLRVDPHLVTSITGYLTYRPQFVSRGGQCVHHCDQQHGSTAGDGAVSSPFCPVSQQTSVQLTAPPHAEC